MNPVRINPKIYSAAIYDRSAKRKRREPSASCHGRLLYVFSGELTYVTGGEKPKPLGAGSLLYLPAGTSCAVRGQFLRAALLSFDIDDGSSPSPFDRVIQIDEFEAVWEDLVRICDLVLCDDAYSVAKAEALLKLLLIKVAEAADEAALPLRMTETLDEYIREHVADEISNTEIGAIFGYHPFYVSKVLKDTKGMTLRQYIISYRLKASKRMLELTDKSAAEIAEENGFTDASYFAKSFKAAFGMTPKEYRNKFKEDFI